MANIMQNQNVNKQQVQQGQAGAGLKTASSTIGTIGSIASGILAFAFPPAAPLVAGATAIASGGLGLAGSAVDKDLAGGLASVNQIAGGIMNMEKGSSNYMKNQKAMNTGTKQMPVKQAGGLSQGYGGVSKGYSSNPIDFSKSISFKQ